MINIDDLTLGQVKQLKILLGGDVSAPEESHPDIGKKVLIRTYSAGVHFGELVYKKGNECRLKNARRIWYWDGAASLSQLAMEGTSKPSECKFPCAVDAITLEWIEIIPCTYKAITSIEGVKVWEQ